MEVFVEGRLEFVWEVQQVVCAAWGDLLLKVDGKLVQAEGSLQILTAVLLLPQVGVHLQQGGLQEAP